MIGVMVGCVIPCRPGQMTHLTQEHGCTSIVCLSRMFFLINARRQNNID